MRDRLGGGEAEQGGVPGRPRQRGAAEGGVDHGADAGIASDHREAAHEGEGDVAAAEPVGDAPVGPRDCPGAGGSRVEEGPGLLHLARVEHDRPLGPPRPEGERAGARGLAEQALLDQGEQRPGGAQ